MIAQLKIDMLQVVLVAGLLGIVMILLTKAVECKELGDRFYTIGNQHLSVTLDTETMGIHVVQKNTDVTWEMLPGTVNIDGKGILGIDMLSVVELTNISDSDCVGVKVTLELPKEQSEAYLMISIMLDQKDSSMLIEIESPCHFLNQVDYPQIHLKPTSNQLAYSVLPLEQGTIIPSDWAEELSRTAWVGNSWNGYSMPWWGMVNAGSGYVAILETPNDVLISLEHSPQLDKGTRVGASWVHSLGDLRYKRKVRLRFFEQATHVTLAKAYREYSKDVGLFRSLDERIEQNPYVQRLIGAMVIPFWVWMEETAQERPGEFQSIARSIRSLRRVHNDIGSLVIHLDGWGQRGYDNNYPDVLPPVKESGGWEGLVSLSQSVYESGDLFVLHDNYWLYFPQASSFDANRALIGADGKHAVYGYEWAWGRPYLLCPEFVMDYLERNVTEIMSQGVSLTGIYVDQMSGGLPECYSEEHRVSRSESAELRRENFKYLQSLGIVTSTEDGADWLQPYIDFVYRTLFPRKGDNLDELFGVPAPLFSLVYHDSVVVPVDLLNTRSSLLRGLLTGGIPLLSELGSGNLWDASFMQQMIMLSKIHRHVATEEMVSHEFVDDSYDIHRVRYSNGTEIQVDFSSGAYIISGVPEIETE